MNTSVKLLDNSLDNIIHFKSVTFISPAYEQGRELISLLVYIILHYHDVLEG